MSVISTIKDDRKYRLLEDRMQKSDQQQYLSTVTTTSEVAPSVAVFAPTTEIFDLINADDSKASESNKSLSRSSYSPGTKENRETENKNDNTSRNLKRQPNGNIENKSPKIVKTEGGETIPTDQSTAINQGVWGFVRVRVCISAKYHFSI